jgi:hypothetical protein
MPRLAAAATPPLSPKFSLYRKKTLIERQRNMSLFTASFFMPIRSWGIF